MSRAGIKSGVAIVVSALVGAGAGVGAFAAAGGGAGATSAAPAADAATARIDVAQQISTVTEVYGRTAAGVVEIGTSGAGQFGGQGQQGIGSGFVYDKQGHIVTNYHVVQGADRVSVLFADGARRTAEVVGTDPSTDLAVLDVQAPAGQLAPLALADSSTVQVGDGVIAIGSPFGLEGSVTAGIVSALDRQIPSPSRDAITGVIQTDAAINSGNSGGPLLDADGRVIGVNAQIESASGGNDGVGFAIPSNTVRSVVTQLLAGGTVERAFLGVQIATVPPAVAASFGAPAASAVEVTEVTAGGPASSAGLRGANGTTTVEGESYPSGGDVITAVDGEAVRSAESLQAAIAAKRPGDTVELTLYRGGSKETVRVTLGKRPA